MASTRDVGQLRLFVDAIAGRFCGSVTQSRGGEIVVAFDDGAGDGTGADAELAVLCALTLQRELAHAIHCGVAIHRGVRSASSEEVAYVGRQLCRLATGGEVVASSSVWSAIPVRLATVFGPAVDVPVHGLGEPIAVRWTHPPHRP